MKDNGASLLSRTALFVTEDYAMGIYVEETCAVLSHAEVIAKYKTTARALRLRAFKLRKYNVVKGVEFEYLYPARSDNQKKRMVLHVKAAASSSRATLRPRCNYFRQQADMNLRRLHASMSKENGTNSLLRLPAHAEISGASEKGWRCAGERRLR